MKCPKCGSEMREMKVMAGQKTVLSRRNECLNCGHEEKVEAGEHDG